MKNKNGSANKKTGILAVLMVGLVGFSCTKVPSSAAKKEPLNILYSSSVISVPAVAIAKEKHYFEEEGLDPKFTILASGAIEALSIGKADVMLTGIIPSLSFAAQGSDIKIVGGTISGGNFVFTKPENAAKYARLADWKGARLGTVRLSTSEMVSRYALGQLGLNMDAKSSKQDITFVEIDNYANIIEGVRKGQVDIGFVSYEYREALQDLGLAILFPMTDMYHNYVCCRETAYGPSLRDKRSAFVKFFKAQIRAYKDYLENEDEIVSLFVKLSSQEPDFVRNALYSPEKSAGRTYHPDPDLRRTSAVYSTLQQYNYVPLETKITDIVDYSPYKDALDEIVKQYPGDPVYTQMLADFTANNINL